MVPQDTILPATSIIAAHPMLSREKTVVAFTHMLSRISLPTKRSPTTMERNIGISILSHTDADVKNA